MAKLMDRLKAEKNDANSLMKISAESKAIAVRLAFVLLMMALIVFLVPLLVRR
ncbi:hypothetical protein [Bosea beijingensis]|uniref:hypothetical protein n=1 Tax=Bosea beijingensis TaxID=3068632 RepID=UPI002741AE75|nr:hypothetical protein [Bosea sp. REN20]